MDLKQATVSQNIHHRLLVATCTCHQRSPPFDVSEAILLSTHSCRKTVNSVVEIIPVRLSPVSSEIVKHSGLFSPGRSYDDISAVHWVEANCMQVGVHTIIICYA